MIGWRTAWTIARRDLSARFRGLRLLLSCLMRGVAALAAIGTLSPFCRDQASQAALTVLASAVLFPAPEVPANDAKS